jgi:amino acid transporter
VFTPSILTILGVIMFMRSDFVVGQAGIRNAVLILLIAKSITTLTALSLSAISTNMQVRGGGAYFLISRVLGPDFGGGIGLALFMAQAVSVPFYILGFAEALVRTFPPLVPHFQWLTLGSAAVLFVIAFIGAGWAIRTQYVIMTVLGLSIVAFMGGAARLFSADTFLTNLSSGYTVIDPDDASRGTYGFWPLFAIYFPAVTGILAGVNMSGDLKDPARSLPRGTLAAIGVGFVVYLIQMLVCGGAFGREELIARPYQLLQQNALFGAGFLVAAGVCAATLSSALGSYLGAPRVLQAVARDGILAFLRPFARGSTKGDEPRRGLVFTGMITLGVLLWAGNEASGGPLNAVAALITMFFLYTYGMTNASAFLEGFVHNPSFRPRFRLFHWSVALAGAVGCVGAALLIDWRAAIYAVLLIGLLLWYVRTRQFRVTFRDARRGLVYESVRRGLFRLAEMQDDPKNWRPTVLVFSGNPATREGLVTYTVWLEAGRGIALLANILIGTLDERREHRQKAIDQLERFCSEKDLLAFPMVVVADSIEQGVSMLLQTSTVGSIAPNLAVFGWTDNPEQIGGLVRHARQAMHVGMSVALLRTPDGPVLPKGRRIDVWWRGSKNGSLMMLLSHLLTLNWEWAGARIRLLQEVSSEEDRDSAMRGLQQLVETARVQASPEVIVSERPFADILHDHSGDAGCVFLGLEFPEEGVEGEWHGNYQRMLAGMPPTVMVHSSGQEDVFA